MHDTILPGAGRPASISIPRLRAAFNGRVIAPDDAGYDRARTVFLGDIDRRPAVIIRPADATDVSRVISLATETGLELAVRSGGHSAAGHSVTDGGIMLDLSDMRRLDIDPQQRTAWAQTGLTAGQYTTATGAHGLATGFGDTGSVGIGGITLGGGIGYLVRKHGLTIDNLLAAELVTADGQLLRVDNQAHPELFWAIRGGGGNFGVATRFQFRLHQVQTIVGGILILPATPEVIAGFIAEAEARPRTCRPSPTSCPPRRCRSCPPSSTAGWWSWPCSSMRGRPRPGSAPSPRSASWPSRWPTWSGRCPTQRSIRRTRTATRPR